MVVLFSFVGLRVGFLSVGGRFFPVVIWWRFVCGGFLLFLGVWATERWFNFVVIVGRMVRVFCRVEEGFPLGVPLPC